MTTKEIPFRPKLDGEFRVRFYNAVSIITSDTSVDEIVDLSKKEIEWVENKCQLDIAQRKKYRAVLFLFRDLVRASWKTCFRDGVLYMSPPTPSKVASHGVSSPEAKKLIRGWMSESRHERLVNFTSFIHKIEKNNAKGFSIADLIADGMELASRLEKVHKGKLAITDAVKPYLQLVRENERDEFTGIKLSEIWRYFRLTWSTPAETTPGRTMQYLIRDAAHPKHAVIGIASLENCAVQITSRDNFIGWHHEAFIEKISTFEPTQIREEFIRLLSYLEDGIRGIKCKGLCKTSELKKPTSETVKRLQDLAVNAEQKRQNLIRNSNSIEFTEKNKSELGSISIETEETLYTRKRAEQLARLLKAKKHLKDVLDSSDFDESWKDFCKSESGISAISSALRAQKIKHIGSSMMELNICGAIPPYNEILGGKLVALLVTSPQVIHDYKERYSNRRSEIASRLKGTPVCRPADLVYLGTTSLYFVGSSQYNRLKIPGKVFDSNFDIIWKMLGMTIGYGTLHISKATTICLSEATEKGHSKINHVFGEGASPKMRLLTRAIRDLLESNNEDTKEFSKHAMPRIVYGVCLAKNTLEYLLGTDDSPDYYTDIARDYVVGTQKIIDFWSHRWLASRLNYTPIYERIRQFNKSNFMISNQIDKNEEWSFSKLEENARVPTNEEQNESLKFIRDFYRGSSAYADHVNSTLLSSIHLETNLDKAILSSVKSNRDIVLTGNPGDGKTHIIRVLKKKLDKLGKPMEIVLDASTLSNEEIYQRWVSAHDNRIPFVIAINAAVLFSLHQFKPDFEPISKAYAQMVHSVVYHSETEEDGSVVVYDLSKREVLTPNILKQAILKLTDEKHYKACTTCKFYRYCDVHKHIFLLRDPLFQERLYIVLKRVSLQGYHATLREIQSFISYLIFGDRHCSKIAKTSGNPEYDVTNLIFSGKGKFFKAIQSSIDPINISHPILDEKILSNEFAPESWINGFTVPRETISIGDTETFNLRKRQFYFFNKQGSELLDILDDDASLFEKFLATENKKVIKELIRKLNAFFGADRPSNTELQIWAGHRYDNEPRKVLISLRSMKISDFKIGRPNLLPSMRLGIEMNANYLLLETKKNNNAFLKIDFGMYALLTAAEKGVPVLFMESDLVKKVWRFIEQLQSSREMSEDDDDFQIALLDVQNKKKVTVRLDRDETNFKYVSIEGHKE